MPGRDVKRDLAMHVYISYLSLSVFMERNLPVVAYRDNFVKRVGNSHVIAFCRVGSVKRVELLSDGSVYSVINT